MARQENHRTTNEANEANGLILKQNKTGEANEAVSDCVSDCDCDLDSELDLDSEYKGAGT